MKRLLILTFICLISAFVKVQGKSSSTPIIYIDGNGVMRWSDTRREASFFGVNYTLPFAHAYRAIGYLELDRKAAIDKDGNVLGFWETIYDLKQPLKTYLDNSAQALVAWSDATSGASFKEETDF